MPGRADCYKRTHPEIVLALTCCIAGEVRRIVLKCSDIFEQLRGSGTVDKIKKYRRDSPSGDFTDLGRRDLPQPPASVNPDGRGR